MSTTEDLQGIRDRALEAVASAQDLRALEEVRVAVAGKKGELTAVLRAMGQLSAEERPVVGKLANEVRAAFEAALEQRKEALAAAELESRMAAEAVDVTLPGRAMPMGHQHVINSILEEMEDFFVGIGYRVMDGPRIETEYYNFTATRPCARRRRVSRSTPWSPRNLPST